jgi:hypothetical protein
MTADNSEVNYSPRYRYTLRDIEKLLSTVQRVKDSLRMGRTPRKQKIALLREMMAVSDFFERVRYGHCALDLLAWLLKEGHNELKK